MPLWTEILMWSTVVSVCVETYTNVTTAYVAHLLREAFALLSSLHLTDINDTDQLFGHKPQRERVQQKSEDTEHHLE